MKIATWNVNSLNVRLPQVKGWLEQNPVDVLCMQELKLVDERFPRQDFEDLGYQGVDSFGQPTYNGVATISRAAGRDVVRNIPGFDDAQSRVLTLTVSSEFGDLRIINAYFVNGQEPGSDKFRYKLDWLRHLHGFVAGELRQHPRLVLLGDFNITADDRDSWDPVGLKGTIHHTDEEREALRSLLALGLFDSFRQFEQPEKTFSWWDYRMLGFQKNRGLRIDYVLLSDALRPMLRACHIDRAPRKLPKPSDHAPVVVTLEGAA
ncbi:exodeoxyribonuclease III [Corticibacter populi]|uniref:Exodeoxyribonuclease III n=1 Tax=Corticibacter populi TaxID=1550736 RepID=A0A3M6R0Q4_9BURK|nr:exodeoxyribonuclease III [Corticibacter populi]RMX08753.1 exodeoxyribonuclease III [Corticibacter populi]RZS36108.1 exodeoxyribonuclease-3 [Corticibacter populi]